MRLLLALLLALAALPALAELLTFTGPHQLGGAPSTRTLDRADFIASSSATPPADGPKWMTRDLPDARRDGMQTLASPPAPSGWYRFELPRRRPAGDAPSLYLWRAHGRVEVWFAGARVAPVDAAERAGVAGLRTPLLVDLSGADWRRSRGRVYVRVQAATGTASMAPAFLGPREPLAAALHVRERIEHGLPLALAAGTLGVAVLALGLAAIRRRAVPVVWLAGAALLSLPTAVRSLPWLDAWPLDLRAGAPAGAVVDVTLVLALGALVHGLHRWAGFAAGRRDSVLVAIGLALAAITPLLSLPLLDLVRNALALGGLGVLVILASELFGAWRSGASREAGVALVAVTLLAAATAHDLLFALRPDLLGWGFDLRLLGAAVPVALLVVLGSGWRSLSLAPDVPRD